METHKFEYLIPGEKVDVRHFDSYTIEDHTGHLIRGLAHALCRGREPNIPYSTRRIRDLFVVRSRSI